MAANRDSHYEVHGYRAMGKDIVEIDFTSEQGLQAHLAALDHRAHPAAALPAWQQLFEDEDDAADAVIVTGDDVLADQEFQRALEGLGLASWHIGTVSRPRVVSRLTSSPARSHLLRSTRSYSRRILSPRASAARSTTGEGTGPTPALLNQPALPLLLSPVYVTTAYWHVAGDGVYSITKERRLLHWTHPTEAEWRSPGSCQRGW